MGGVLPWSSSPCSRLQSFLPTIQKSSSRELLQLRWSAPQGWAVLSIVHSISLSCFSSVFLSSTPSWCLTCPGPSVNFWVMGKFTKGIRWRKPPGYGEWGMKRHPPLERQAVWVGVAGKIRLKKALGQDPQGQAETCKIIRTWHIREWLRGHWSLGSSLAAVWRVDCGVERQSGLKENRQKAVARIKVIFEIFNYWPQSNGTRGRFWDQTARRGWGRSWCPCCTQC